MRRFAMTICTLWLIALAVTAWAGPPARYFHAMAPLLDGSALLFGGIDEDGNVLGDAWVFTMGEKAGWTQLNTANMPAPLCAQAMETLDDGTVFMFSGSDEERALLDGYYRFEGYDWTPRLNFNTSFVGRENLTARLLADGRVGVLGGVSDEFQLTDDFLIYDPETESFEAGPSFEFGVAGAAVATRGNDFFVLAQCTMRIFIKYEMQAGWDTEEPDLVPPPRYNPAQAQIGDTLYMFGGWSWDDDTLGDAWAFDTQTHTFTQLADPPFSVAGPMAVPLRPSFKAGEARSILIFGGMYYNTTLSGETWFYYPETDSYGDEPLTDDDDDTTDDDSADDDVTDDDAVDDDASDDDAADDDSADDDVTDDDAVDDDASDDDDDSGCGC